MSCLCRGGCAGTTTYSVFDPATVKFSGEVTLCTVCESKLSSEPTIRERQYEQQTLRWQHWDDRKRSVRLEVEPDHFAAAFAALPADFHADFPAAIPILDGDVSELDGELNLGCASAIPDGDGFGTEAY